jgi:hypothetical protein
MLLQFIRVCVLSAAVVVVAVAVQEAPETVAQVDQQLLDLS